MLIAHYVSCAKMYINLGWFGCDSALIFQEMVNYFRASSLCQLSCICMAHDHPTDMTQMTPQNHRVTRPVRASSHVYFKEKFLLEVTRDQSTWSITIPFLHLRAFTYGTASLGALGTLRHTEIFAVLQCSWLGRLLPFLSLQS